ncbi:MAG: ATP phosphoribosyltransferase [Pseudomonadota bacterium]
MTVTLALPSKGRLKGQAIEVFEKAGFPVVTSDDSRTYHGQLGNCESVDIKFLSASEIARELAKGTVHLGVTGEDLVRENIADWSSKLALKAKLGFGGADVVVGVPDAWIDVTSMSDLNDVAAEFRSRHGRRLRVATKYWTLTQQHFAEHGVALYRIVESLGATEGAPASGAADLIVDITSTGSTLRANGLKILEEHGVILESQANLVESLTADRGAEDQAEIDRICSNFI